MSVLGGRYEPVYEIRGAPITQVHSRTPHTSFLGENPPELSSLSHSEFGIVICVGDGISCQLVDSEPPELNQGVMQLRGCICSSGGIASCL